MNEITERSVVEEITKLARRIRRFTAHSEHHLSRLDTLKLNLLDNPGINLRNLARRMDIRPPSLSEGLDKLLEEGLIIKERDENDKRAIRLYLSPEGQNQAKALKARDETPDFLGEFLTEAEKEQLYLLCDKLNNGLDEKRKQRQDDRPEGEKSRGDSEHRKHHKSHRVKENKNKRQRGDVKDGENL